MQRIKHFEIDASIKASEVAESPARSAAFPVALGIVRVIKPHGQGIGSVEPNLFGNINGEGYVAAIVG